MVCTISADVFLDFSSGTAVRKEEHVVKAESPEEEQVKQIDDEEVVNAEEKKEMR